MNLGKIGRLIMAHEGFSSKAYKCTAGKTTVGYGRNLDDKGITEAEAKLLLRNDIVNAIIDLQSVFSDFHNFSENRQAALVDMRYNLGGAGFRKFKKMIHYINADDFKLASEEMKKSKWYYQVKTRAEKLFYMVKVG